MSKHIQQSAFHSLPSGAVIHPCRLIQRDGTLMWKHALLYANEMIMPSSEAHEQHIIKTAQRLEELNAWVSQDLEPWECLVPAAWYVPIYPELSDGIALYFKHFIHDNDLVYNKLLPHIQEHETLELRKNYLFFKRC